MAGQWQDLVGKRFGEPADLASRSTSSQKFLFLCRVRGSINKLKEAKMKEKWQFSVFQIFTIFKIYLHWVLARAQLNSTLNHTHELCESVSHCLKSKLAVWNKSTLITGNYPKERIKQWHKNVQARAFLLQHYSEH